LLSSLFITSISIGLLNIYYYTHHYLIGTGHDKFEKSLEDISFKLLSAGRSFFQPLFSYWPTPASYYPGSYLNILGLILLLLFISLMIKFKRVQLFIWFVFAFLPIAVTTFHMTNIFGTDSYLLNTGIGLYVILSIVLNQKLPGLSQKIKKLLVVFFILTTAAYLHLCIQVADSFKSNYSLFKFVSRIEPNPFVMKAMIKEHLLKNEFDFALEKSLQIIHWDTYGKNSDLMFSQSVYKHPSLTPFQKIKLLQGPFDKYPHLNWTSYYLSMIYAQLNNFNKAFDILDKMDPEYYIYWGEDLSVIMAEYLYICEKIKTDCSDVKRKIKTAHESKDWNENIYLKRLSTLKK
jgi:hypothetical protein